MKSGRRCAGPFQPTCRGYIVALRNTGIDLEPVVITSVFGKYESIPA